VNESVGNKFNLNIGIFTRLFHCFVMYVISRLRIHKNDAVRNEMAPSNIMTEATVRCKLIIDSYLSKLAK